MSSKKRQVFLKRWATKQVRGTTRWAEYQAARAESMAKLRAAGLSETTVLYRSVLDAARRVGVDVDRGIAIWKRKVAKATQDSMLAAGRKLGNSLPKGRAALIALMVAENARLEAVKAVEDAKKAIQREERREHAAKLHAAKARADKEEAKAKANQLRYEMYREKRNRLRNERLEAEKERAIMAAEKARATQERYIVSDDGKVDIVRDVAWVYANMATLVVVSEDGKIKRLNPEVIHQAPSNGAVAFATYLLEKPSEFLEKFAIRLFPKDASAAPKDPAAKQRAIDPTLEDLGDYLKD